MLVNLLVIAWLIGFLIISNGLERLGGVKGSSLVLSKDSRLLHGISLAAYLVVGGILVFLFSF